MRLEMRQVSGRRGSIDDEKPEVAQIGDHQIIANAARLVGQHRVALPAGLEPHHIHRDQPFQLARHGQVIARKRAH